jgi:2-polyprenyl-6-methoxyphenol hydroxylase-like FAD-dependent oxidoreductase
MDTREERMLSARLIIDAHGSWEPLAPHHARHQHHCLPSDLFAFKANFADTKLEHGVLPVLSFQGGYGGIVLGDHGMATLAFCLRRDALEQARVRISDISAPEAAAQWVLDHCKELPAMLAGANRKGKWLGSGPLRPGIRITQTPETSFHIGNAAGEAHPIIGEGISMAVQSAALLANMLLPYKMEIVDAQVQERIRTQYAKAWCRHFSRRVRMAALFAHAAMRPQTYGSLLPLLTRYPALLGHFARWCDKVRPGPDMNNGEAPTR